MMDSNKALVVFSGGQDSTTCLFWAKKHFKEVHAITFLYGQRHKIEVEKARKIAAQAGVPITVREVNFIGEISTGCSLIDPKVKMDPVKPEKTMPNTFVPGRNLFFLSIAAVHAREIGAKNIITGVSQTDFSGYPDCRDSFIRSLNVSLNVTINLAMDEQFLIHTPLMWLNKAQTWKLADELGVFDLVRNETLTCYNGIPGDGCGNCPACQLRMKGLQEYLESKKSQL